MTIQVPARANISYVETADLAKVIELEEKRKTRYANESLNLRIQILNLRDGIARANITILEVQAELNRRANI